MAVGKYTFSVKDSKNELGTVVVEVKSNLGVEFEPNVPLANANARMASTLDIGTITVRWQSTGKETTIRFATGVKGTYNPTSGILEVTVDGINKRYAELYNKDNHDEFIGFYEIAYTGPPCKPLQDLYENGVCKGSACAEGFLPASYYATQGRFIKDMVKWNPALSTETLATEIDKLLDEMMDDGTYDKLIKEGYLNLTKSGIKPDKNTLLALKQLLTDYRELQLAQQNSITLTWFNEFVKEAQKCWNYKDPENSGCTSAGGIIPRCWWDKDPAGSIVPPALVAGFVDNIYRTISGLAGLAWTGLKAEYTLFTHFDCWINPTYYIWTANTAANNCQIKRNEDKALFNTIKNKGVSGVWKDVKDIGGQVISAIGDDFVEWGKETLQIPDNTNGNCTYYKLGGLIPEIVAIFGGVEELKIAGNSATLIAKTVAKTQEVGKGIKLWLNFTKLSAKEAGLRWATNSKNFEIFRKLESGINAVLMRSGTAVVTANGKVLALELLAPPVTITPAIQNAAITFFKTLPQTPVGTAVLKDLAPNLGKEVFVQYGKDATGKAITLINEQLPNGKFKPLYYFIGTVAYKLSDLDIEDDLCEVCFKGTTDPQELAICKNMTIAKRKAAAAGMDAQTAQAALQKICNAQSTKKNVLIQTSVEIALNSTDNEVKSLLEDVNGNVVNCPTNTVDGYMYNNLSELTTQKIQAWKIYKEANRTCLPKSEGHLAKLVRANTNPNLKTTPYSFTRTDFINIAKAGGSAGSFTANFDNTIFPNLVNFAKVSATYINMDKLKAKLSQQNSGATLEGTNFIVKYMGEHTSEFNGGNYEFEAYENTWARYVDVQDNRVITAPILYEFKSVQDISPADFATQFTKDLSSPNVSQLSQIRWIFDHDKMDATTVKTKVLAALNGNKNLLNNPLIINRFDIYAESVGYQTKINTIDELITFLNTNNNWFNLIFK